MPEADSPEIQPNSPESLDLSVDDTAYLKWARDLGFDQEVLKPNDWRVCH